MQIHVVRPGQTLWGISQAYGVPLETLIQSNQIENPEQLVVGQAIVIPIWGRYHWVQPGESLYLIGQRYNVPWQELQRINQIADPAQLPVGLRLYIPQQRRIGKDINGYLEPPFTRDPVGLIRETGAYLTYLSLFSYEVNADGTVTPLDDQPIINEAYNQRVVPLMVITNIEEEEFSTELAATILGNEELQDRLLDEVVAMMDEKGFLGLNVDFEYVRPEDRERYNQFLRKAAARMRERGYSISTAVAPKVRGDQPGLLYEAHDYPAHGEIVDFVILMTYEWGWTGGPPMAVAPLDQVRRVIEYAVSVIPRGKIMMGMPLYGYDWTLPFIPGETFARTISPQEAIRLALRYRTSIEYDPRAQSPFFRYTDEQGRQHEVWFEDARSVQAKFNLVKEFDLRGVSYWVLRVPFPQNWLLIEDNFVVNKRV
ncbi:spore germination protein [Caldalkalibacillus uzonensis]|uniref:Spore germination protein n=1 Tax=Caldalkalibacillus uzonensis TaxID=353224 RepID=A0ABU0CN00_9BACI|nr:LysM peptidoglycan-binding domain-containing protein [Caldalkalibacillus uzonensis]MDQ0337784.1 spore germination protein [Caldalkalibacillus uzonensis]